MGTLDPIKTQIKDGSIIKLRSGGLEDASALMEYESGVFKTSPYVITEPDEFKPNIEKQKDRIKGFLEAEGGILILALYGGKIIGNIDLRNNGSRRRIAHRGSFGMSVSQEFRGRGVGKALLLALIEWCKRENNPIEKIELGVLSENEAGIGLYESLGFKREGLVEKAAKVGDKYIDEMHMGLWVGK